MLDFNSVIDFLDNINLSKENCALERFEISKIAFEKLGFCVDPQKVILVAGTNGKGTTSATLAALLESAGYKVGLYTSPHLVKVNERIKVDFKDISDEDFVDSFSFVKENLGGVEISQFEYFTFIACHHFFVREKVDYVVFEVGLGGLYDATNVIPHNMCVITKLGFDHEKYLGNTIESIAENKFGIINNPADQVVVYLDFKNPSVEEILFRKNAKRFVKNIDFKYEVDAEQQPPVFYIKTAFGKAKLALPGYRACENTALAITTFAELGFNVSENMEAISSVKWPGRMDSINVRNRRVYLSGDHNPQGIDSLIEILQYYEYEKIHFIVGIAIDKDFGKILEKLSTIPRSEIYLTETAFKPRAICDYGEWLDKCKRADKDRVALLRWVVENASQNDIVVVTGSLYLVGDILQLYKA